MTKLSQPKTILVVDDDETARIVLTRLLALLGHTAESAESGLEAIARVGNTSYDLLIIDLNMPVMDGLETLKQIKGMKPAQAALIVSGDPRDARIQEALQQGAAGLIMKPVQLDNLKDALDRIW